MSDRIKLSRDEDKRKGVDWSSFGEDKEENRRYTRTEYENDQMSYVKGRR